MDKKIWEACVIGCGQIGSEVLKELVTKLGTDEVCGVDVNPDTVYRLNHQGFTTFYNIPHANNYIICTWTTESVLKVFDSIGTLKANEFNLPLIFIESTFDPMCISDIEFPLSQRTIFFPHRWMENDPEHGIYNQKRVAGTDSTWAKEDAIKFLSKIMDVNLIHWTNSQTAVLSKVVENTYRAMEIIIAQELKNACEDLVDFEQVRQACNTKWNIKIMEARDGVKKKCLPKDLDLFNKYFDNNIIFKLAEMLNKKYIEEYDSK
jgi:UDP-N-acetyl-D-mannosaminuronate dehydrogenase